MSTDGKQRTRTESEEDSRVFFGDPHRIHYAGMIMPARPGVQDCFEMLEHAHFKPGTLRNDLFHLRLINWEGLIWGIVSIPIADKELMERMAQVNGLRITDSIPVMIGGGVASKFPIESPNLFTFTNVPDHPTYKH